MIPAELYELMYRRTRLSDGTTHPYGYGWVLNEFRGRRRISHGGGIFGFNTIIARYPEARLAVIILSNTSGSRPERLEREITELLLARKRLRL